MKHFGIFLWSIVLCAFDGFQAVKFLSIVVAIVFVPIIIYGLLKDDKINDGNKPEE